MSLFPAETAGPGGGAGGGGAGGGFGVEFRCGRMVAERGACRADPRRGLFRVLRAPDALVHAQWLERPAGSSAPPRLDEDCDLIVFPGEARVRRVGPRAARAFELSFQQPGRALVFWMQEPATAGLPESEGGAGRHDLDEQLWNQVHVALGNPGEAFPHVAAAGAATPPATAGAAAPTPAAPPPPPRGASRRPPSQPPGAEERDKEWEKDPRNPKNRENRMPPGAADPPPLDGAPRGSPAPGDNTPAPGAGGGGAGGSGTGGDPQLAAALLAGVMAGRAERGPSLAEVLRPDALLPLLDNPEVQEQVRPYLPEEHRGAEDITRLATSPQFREQLEVFSRALQSGQLDLQQFGLEAAGFSAADFLQGIERMVAKQEEEQGGGGNQPEDSMDQD